MTSSGKNVNDWQSGNSLISGKLSSVNSDGDHVLEKVLQTWHYLHISRNSLN
jgi:hypothetical protein